MHDPIIYSVRNLGDHALNDKPFKFPNVFEHRANAQPVPPGKPVHDPTLPLDANPYLKTPQRTTLMSRIIDWHNHWLSAARGGKPSRDARKTPYITVNDKGEKIFTGSTAPGALAPLTLATGFTSVDERLRHLDEVGVERQVISWPTTFGTDAALSAEEGDSDLARLQRGPR